MTEATAFDMLNQLQFFLESDTLLDEVGFIHPSQFAALDEDGGASLHQSLDTISEKVEHKSPIFWSRDHKLGISTQALLPLYKSAKHMFLASIRQYQMLGNRPMQDGNVLSGFSSSQSAVESEVMKHSKALLLLSSDFVTAWNSRKLVLSKKQNLSMFMEELLLSALVLSHSPKSEQAWSQRRWVIKIIAGKFSDLQQILGKESELVEKIAEKSKMNYRAWNHRCWLVSYMTGEQALHELKKSRNWAGLHVADNSCFHYRRRLMLRILEDSYCKQDPKPSSGLGVEIHEVCKEELDWNEMLIKRYIGREALWLHRRFLALCWIKHFVNHDVDIFVENELQLFQYCSTLPDNGFEDVQAQAIFSGTCILWLAKHSLESELEGIELQEKLRAVDMKMLLFKICPEKSYLWTTLMEQFQIFK